MPLPTSQHVSDGSTGRAEASASRTVGEGSLVASDISASGGKGRAVFGRKPDGPGAHAIVGMMQRRGERRLIQCADDMQRPQRPQHMRVVRRCGRQLRERMDRLRIDLSGRGALLQKLARRGEYQSL